MNVTTSQVNGISVVRVSEARLTYPLLTAFVNTVTGLITAGDSSQINLETVSYVGNHHRLPDGSLLPGDHRGCTEAAASACRDHVDHDRGTGCSPRRSGVGHLELWSLIMARTITTSAGSPIELDGDVLAVIETISRDLTRQNALDYGFEEVDREFQALVAQMNEDELRAYLKESLFMSFNRFENERMSRIIRKAGHAADHDTGV
jgi:hypothetical protein